MKTELPFEQGPQGSGFLSSLFLASYASFTCKTPQYTRLVLSALISRVCVWCASERELIHMWDQVDYIKHEYFRQVRYPSYSNFEIISLP